MKLQLGIDNRYAVVVNQLGICKFCGKFREIWIQDQEDLQLLAKLWQNKLLSRIAINLDGF